jgi:hypothetical protein
MWAIPKTERSSITASSRKISSLRGGEERPIEFHKSAGEIRDTMEKLDSEECTFSLRVSYEDSQGKLKEGRYPFGGFGRNGSLIIIVGVGEALI